MGMLVEGKWRTGGWPLDKTGRFKRAKSVYRDWIEQTPGARFTPEPGRYHLYVSYACPWAHRTLILRKLKKLTPVISLSVVDPLMGEEGWHFSEGPGCIPDSANQARFLREVYLLADPKVTSRVTVPVLWDKKEKTIVNNESREIVRMFDREFQQWADPGVDFCPRSLEKSVDQRIDEIYQPINNGVYRCGFAKSQEAYEEAVQDLFSALDHFEQMLGSQPYLCGKEITEADWCFFTTLIRFDLVYHYHFKCNLRRILDYPHLWNYLQRLYHIPGVAETCHFEHIKNHYFHSHESVNPSRIIPKGPANLFQTEDQRIPVYQGRYLTYYFQKGWEYVERSHGEGAVYVIGMTVDQKVLLVEQNRIPMGKPVIEFPAGLVNDQKDLPSEKWEDNARRELMEETGYTAGKMDLLTKGPISPGMSNEIVAFYLASDLKKVGAGGGVGSESITVHEVPLPSIRDWLRKCEKAGKWVDPKVYIGLYFLAAGSK